MSAHTLQKIPELLSPAGNFLCAKAAVENGADAVYFGLDCGFNARARAENISLQTLPQLIELLHGRGVKAFVTMNTLIFSDEIPRFEAAVRDVATAGVDAILVQDIGMARLIRAVCPDLDIHASTQMTMTSAETIAEIESLNIQRIVLARELSIEEIAKIAAQTTIELEVFAHGALCVAYSGQCMTSESLGGRSANRGQCAQACRLPYELICDGQDVDLGDQQYLLSPQDLAAYDLIPELIRAGVACIKIEGRLKTPEYVANITRRYREALDSAAVNCPISFSPDVVEEMELSFSRGFSAGWLNGCDHKMLVPATSSSKHGVPLGRVIEVNRDRVQVELSCGLRTGDGVVFDGDRVKNEEQGGRVYEIWKARKKHDSAVAGEMVSLAFAHGSLDSAKIAPGVGIWKTDDPRLTKRLKRSFAGNRPLRKLPITIQVEAMVGKPLSITARSSGCAVTVQSSAALEVARQHAVTREFLAEQLSRLGNTAYQLKSLTADIVGAPMVPLSVLGVARRELTQRLNVALAELPVRHVAVCSVLPELRPDSRSSSGDTSAPPTIHVLARSIEQLQWLIDMNQDSCIVDFQDIRQYGDAVRLAHGSDTQLLLATPRIQKPGEMGVFHAMAKHEPDGILARNLSAMAYFRPKVKTVVADFSLNCTNEITAAWLMEKGADRITASYDMNREQLLCMVESTPSSWLEIVVHQHMPMFHMEHCVFCAVLSPGTNKTNCGRPCDFHKVEMRDRVGMRHVLHADVGCRNTLYNAQPQSAAEVVPTLLKSGLRHFRVELLGTEPQSDVRQLLGLYRQLLADELNGREVWTRLNAANRVGVTRGTLEEKRNPLAIL